MTCESPVLEAIEIAKPCTVSWDAMAGDERSRFCPQCRMNVYNVAGMTRAEADALVGAAEGRLCLRLYKRRDGTVLTADCPGDPEPQSGWVAAIAAITAALTPVTVGILAAVFGNGRTADWREAAGPMLRPVIEWIDRSPRVFVMGEACPPPLPPGPGPTTPGGAGGASGATGAAGATAGDD